MITKYATKRDINGNRYTLIVNDTEKTFERSYNPYDYSDYITIGKRDRNKLIEQLIENGYTQI